MSEEPVRVPWSWGVGAALAGLLLVLVRVPLSHLPLGLPLDDAWIHCAFASHLARFHQWGLFAHQPSGGESSPLWPLLLSAGEWGGWRAAPRLALLLGVLSFLPLPGLLASLASSPTRARVVAVVTGLFGPLLFLALSGMETLAALTLSMAGLHAFVDRRPARAALWVGAAAFLRPDAALLLLVFAVFTSDRRRLLGGAALAVAAVAMLAALEGRFPPATLAGRRWLMGLPPAVESGSLGRGALTLIGQWVHAIGADLGGGRVVSAHASTALVAARMLWKLSLLAVLGLGLAAVFQRRHRGALLLISWAAVVLSFYALVLPDRGHVGRYQPQIHLVILLLAVEGAARLWQGRVRLRVAAAAASLLLLSGWIGGTAEVAGLWADAVDQLQRVHVDAAAELDRLLPADSRVAVFDVGAAAYLHDGGMLDLSGLSDPDLTRLLPRAQEGAVVQWLRDHGATHVLLPVWPQAAGDGLDRRLGLRDSGAVRLLELRRWRGRPQSWARAFQFSGHVFPELVLYRLEWIR